MSGEWLLRFRALRNGSDLSETCADSANSAESSLDNCVVIDGAANSGAIDAIGPFGTHHSKRPSSAQPSWRVTDAPERSATVVCIVCRRDVTDSPTHWWGGEPCHVVCGETAFDEARTRGDYQLATTGPRSEHTDG
jgi:hypothetical protein